MLAVELSSADRNALTECLLAEHEASLRRTARRFSICADDAADAFQRGLEILLTKAPTSDLVEIKRWTHTVIKNEALAIRRDRERSVGSPPEDEPEDWLTTFPDERDGPFGLVGRREDITHSYDLSSPRSCER